MIKWTSRTRISSLTRGPSLRAGSGALIGRRMAQDSSAVATIPTDRAACHWAAPAANHGSETGKIVINGPQVNAGRRWSFVMLAKNRGQIGLSERRPGD